MRKLTFKEWVAVAVAVLFVAYTLFGQTVTNSFKTATSKTGIANSAATTESQISNTLQIEQTNVGIKDIIVGSGAEILPGMAVGVNYVLKLSDGTIIQDSKQVNSGEPFNFIYGQGQLIPGWELGIKGMRVGGKRIITIPPALGYGVEAVGPIPANATLVFEIEVVSAQLAQ